MNGNDDFRAYRYAKNITNWRRCGKKVIDGATTS